MIRTGEVIERGAGTLTVVFERPEACKSCNGCLSKGCMNVEIPGDAAVGDLVEVEMPDKNVVKASAIAYLLPLLFLLLGLILGGPAHGALGLSMNADVFSALLGGILLLGGFSVVFGIDKRLRGQSGYTPRIVRVHTRDEASIQAQHKEE